MVDFIVKADTPDQFRKELVDHLRHLRRDAKVHVDVKHQAPKTREKWRNRYDILEEAISFIEKIKIEPFTTPDLHSEEQDIRND